MNEKSRKVQHFPPQNFEVIAIMRVKEPKKKKRIKTQHRIFHNFSLPEITNKNRDLHRSKIT